MAMNETGGGEPKTIEIVPRSAETNETGEQQTVEHRSGPQESSVGKHSPPAAIQSLPLIPDIPVTTPVTFPQDDTATPVSSPVTAKIPAADADRIEKQWVDKAKAIVAQTKSDPFKQKNEMSKIKADYIGKRYNKTVKTEPA